LVRRRCNAAMVAGLRILWAIAAAVVAHAAGYSLRLPENSRKAADGGSTFSMLATGSDTAKSGQSTEHPLSWLFGGGDNGLPVAPVQMTAQPLAPAQTVPMPLAPAQMPAAVAVASPPMAQPMSFPVASHAMPAAPGGISTPMLGITPAMPFAGMPMMAGAPIAAPPGAMPVGAIPLANLLPTPAPPPPAAPFKPPAADAQEIAQMRNEIATLRSEVSNGNKDMWNAVKLITSTVEKDETAMQALTQDVQTLRGRHGGSVPLVADECSMRQSSCGDCLAVPTCVWCKVEQRWFSGDSAGPVRGECAFFRHGTCAA